MSNFIKIVKGLGQMVRTPLDILDDWASEPLRSFQNRREQKNKDKDLERSIKEQEFISNLKKEEANHQANLEIKLQTEVQKINIELEEWQKDQQFERMKNVTEAVMNFQKQITDLNINGIRAIGNMDIELREKAQDLILRKTNQYKELQDKAQNDAEKDFERIIEKFSNNERVLNIMIGASETKLLSIINNTAKFLEELNVDIQSMHKNIDRLTNEGQKFMYEQLRQIGPIESKTLQSLEAENRKIEDADDVEII